MAAYRRLLRNRPFALLWAGATISIVGDALTWVSLVWLTVELGGSAFDIALRGRVFALLRTLMQSTPPIGGLAAGILLAGGAMSVVAAIVGIVIGLPGAIGLVHPALSSRWIGGPDPASGRATAAKEPEPSG